MFYNCKYKEVMKTPYEASLIREGNRHMKGTTLDKAKVKVVHQAHKLAKET